MFIDDHKAQQDTTSSQDELSWYLQDLATLPILSPKEEQEMILQMIVDPLSAEIESIRRRLLEAHLVLVVHLARRYQHYGLELSDLVQEGNIVLMKAAQQFDPKRYVRFKPFASRRICWAFSRIAEKHLRENRLMEDIDMETISPLRTPVLKALAHESIDEQSLVFDGSKERFISLFRLLENNDGENLHDDRYCGRTYYNLDNEALEPDEIYDAEELAHCIADCLLTLSIKERFVLIHLYLLENEATRDYVGRMLGVSRERVRQIEARGLRKLRHPHNSKRLSLFLS